MWRVGDSFNLEENRRYEFKMYIDVDIYYSGLKREEKEKEKPVGISSVFLPPSKHIFFSPSHLGIP